MNVIIRADGGNFPEIGTGHIVRSLLLAEFLKNTKEFKFHNFLFATRTDKHFKFGFDKIKQAGYKIINMYDFAHNDELEKQMLLSTDADLIIFDRLNVKNSLITSLKGRARKVVIFDDESSAARVGDLYINSLLQNVKNKDKTLHGNNYLILPKRKLSIKRPVKKVKKIFVCFGGYDANNFSNLFLKEIKDSDLKIEVNLVVSNVTNKNLKELNAHVKQINLNPNLNVNVYERPKNFYKLLRDADLSIVAGGLMAFESVQYGVPSIGIAQYQHQSNNLKRLKNIGVLEIGSFDRSSKNYILKKIQALYDSYDLRVDMSENAINVFDGKALERVARAICKLTVKN